MVMHLLSQLPKQHGLFTAAQARAFGVTDDERRRCVRSGIWVRVRQGIYIDAATWRSASLTARHVIEVVAAQLSVGRRSWASALSACVVHDVLPPFPSIDGVDLTCVEGQPHKGSRLNVRVWVLDPNDRQVSQGISVLSAARTVFDAARTMGFTDAVTVADLVLHRRLASREELGRLAERLYQHRGSPAFARVIAFADGRSESPGETRSRVWFGLHGIPVPELQVDFYDEAGHIGRSDFYWRRQRTIGEFDGRGKYAGDERVLFAEKLREDRLRVDNEVVRFGWSDVDPRSSALATRLQAAFLRGERRPPSRFPATPSRI